MNAVSRDAPNPNGLLGRQNADDLASWTGGSVESSTSRSGASTIYAHIFRQVKHSHFVCAGYADPTIVLHLEPAETIYWRSGSTVLQKTALPAGAVTIAPAEARETEWRASPASYLHVLLADDLVAQIAEQTGRSRHGRYELERVLGGTVSPQLNHLLALVRLETSQTSVASALYMDSLAQALSVQLLQEFSTLKPRPFEAVREGMSRHRLRRVLDYMEENLERDVRLSELATVAGLSAQHFSNLFKQNTGVAPHRYLISRRIERAKILLTTSTLSLTDIAAACGFSDQSHLTNVFRHMVRCTPRRWREGRLGPQQAIAGPTTIGNRAGRITFKNE